LASHVFVQLLAAAGKHTNCVRSETNNSPPLPPPLGFAANGQSIGQVHISSTLSPGPPAYQVIGSCFEVGIESSCRGVALAPSLSPAQSESSKLQAATSRASLRASVRAARPPEQHPVKRMRQACFPPCCCCLDECGIMAALLAPRRLGFGKIRKSSANVNGSPRPEWRRPVAFMERKGPPNRDLRSFRPNPGGNRARRIPSVPCCCRAASAELLRDMLTRYKRCRAVKRPQSRVRLRVLMNPTRVAENQHRVFVARTMAAFDRVPSWCPFQSSATPRNNRCTIAEQLSKTFRCRRLASECITTSTGRQQNSRRPTPTTHVLPPGAERQRTSIPTGGQSCQGKAVTSAAGQLGGQAPIGRASAERCRSPNMIFGIPATRQDVDASRQCALPHTIGPAQREIP